MCISPRRFAFYCHAIQQEAVRREGLYPLPGMLEPHQQTESAIDRASRDRSTFRLQQNRLPPIRLRKLRPTR